MAIYFRVVGGKGIVSAIIKHTTRSWASHAEFIDTDAGTALGAYSYGVGIEPIDYESFDVEKRFTAANINQAYAWAKTQLDKKYDYEAIFGIFLDRDWRDASHWFCSELVAAAFEAAQSPILNPNSQAWRITPRDLLLSTAIVPVPSS